MPLTKLQLLDRFVKAKMKLLSSLAPSLLYCISNLYITLAGRVQLSCSPHSILLLILTFRIFDTNLSFVFAASCQAMEFWSSPLFLWLILPALSHVFTVPQANAQGQSMTINRRTMPQRTPEEWGEWAKKHKESLEAKYGDTTPRKRSSGTNLYVT